MIRKFEVRAYKIASFEPVTQAVTSDWDRDYGDVAISESGRKLVINKEWREHYQPEVGGWWITYPDGRVHYRAAAAFDEGYTLIKGDRYSTPYGPIVG